MEKEKTNKNKTWKYILIIAACAVCAFAIGFTAAYFTDNEAHSNNFNNYLVNTELTEEFPNNISPNPGETIEKVVRVANRHEEKDCYTRVQVLFSDAYMESVSTVDYNESAWEKIGDWWYYREVLKAGQETEPLFTQIVLNAEDSINPRYWTDFSVYLRHESRQARFHESAAEAFEAAY